MGNIMGLVWSMVYIFAVLGVATLVARFTRGASENSRKLVHIMVGNWVFITPMFTELWAVVLVPFSFIIINSLSLKYNIFSAMERTDDSLGTVYYAISMFLLTGAGFALNWPMLPFIGLLIMAYGDGLAAVIGQKWGKRKPFSFAPDKTLAGSMTVAVTAFVITIASILYFGPAQNLANATIAMALFIAGLTAVLAAFIELTGKKGCDNLTLPIGSGLFATLALYYGTTGFFVYLFVSVAILAIAYRMKAISPDGIVAAVLTAVTLYALGGIWIGISLLAFFILGSAVSKIKNQRKRDAESLQEAGGPRNWKQVLCNSLPACVLLWLVYIFPQQDILILLAFAVFAASAADTFSSEIGMLGRGRVFSILTGKTLPNGVSGGVSWLGLGAGIVGSTLLSLLALPQFGWTGMIFVAALGFAGSIVDSILGASIQRRYRGENGQLQDRPSDGHSAPVLGYKLISNNTVNLLTLIVVTVGGHILAYFTILS